MVVTGFEPADLLLGIYRCLLQLEAGIYKVENAYKRAVPEGGNLPARALMEEKIRQIVSHGAAAMGGECDIVYQKGVPAVVCDNHVVDLIEQAATEELGADHVVTLATPSMGSEDFSRYLEKVPGAMFRIGTRNDDPASSRPLHNAGIVFDEQAITSGASVFAGLALRYLH